MRTLLLLIFLLTSISGIAQKSETPIPAAWNGLSFGPFADSLYQNAGIRVFYKPEWTREIKVKVPADGYPLQKVLALSINEKGLFSAIVSEKYIILSKGYALREELQLGSFEGFIDSASVNSGFSEPESLLPQDHLPGAADNQLIDVGKPDGKSGQSEAIFSGSVITRGSGEPVIGATVYAEDAKKGNVTNGSGIFYLKLSRGTHSISVRCIGMKEVFLTIQLHSDGFLNISMEEHLVELNPVVVSSKRFHNIEGAQMGFNRIDSRTISRIPVIGESDVLKVSLLLPGVQSVGEGTTGFNVRGGNADQNLILLDNAPVFNPSHFMGFFSALNADIIREFELHKSVIPPSYGGRLASVLDLAVKNGNKSGFSGNGGISFLTGKLELEGPIVKDKCSFLLSGRNTYSNWLLQQIRNPEINRSQASFSDLNGKIHLEMKNRNSISLSAYHSRDAFSKNKKDTLFYYTNSIVSADWKWKISPRFNMSNNLIYSRYYNSLQDSGVPQQAYKMDYELQYYQQRTDFTYFLNNDHRLAYGISNIVYSLQPGSYRPAGKNSLVSGQRMEKEQALESAFYINEEFGGIDKLLVNAGIRVSNYLSLGPGTSYTYREGLPYELSTITDTILYKRGEISKRYSGIEPRISMRYMAGSNFSVKAGYSRMKQYINILSNSFSISPTDTWKLSDPNLPPQVSDQVSLGFYQNLKHGIFELSLELYYKKLEGLKDYKVAADISMNEQIETEILNCRGKSYGIEFMARKSTGKLNGWGSYTYSRILEKTNSSFTEEQINNNNWFPASYDKPHSASLVLNYQFSRRVSISTDVVYSTGRPITYPVARYTFRGNTFVHYSNRNEFRIPDYFRWDASINLDGNLRITQFAHSFWSLSVYNITGRDNVYSIYFISKGTRTQGYKLSIFARPIVSVTYNFRF
ncbi:MAG: TonB-dependent receptor [Bacteroidales bacterium]